MRRPAAEPVFVARLLGAGRPAWTPYEDPRLVALAAAYELVLEPHAVARPQRGDRIMRVAIYARVSTDAQEARGTIGSQIESLRASGWRPRPTSWWPPTWTTGSPGPAWTGLGSTVCATRPRPAEIEALWCLTPDRLSRLLRLPGASSPDELARHGIAIRYSGRPRHRLRTPRPGC